jgi:ribonucleotide reductase alpha subunit
MDPISSKLKLLQRAWWLQTQIKLKSGGGWIEYATTVIIAAKYLTAVITATAFQFFFSET